MNNIFDKLKEQATEDVLGVKSIDYNMFAELIVRECAEICLEANDYKNILRHFGIEE